MGLPSRGASFYGTGSHVVIDIGSLLVTGLWSVFFPNLRRADALTPEALLNAEFEQTGQEVRKL